jgi:hypothetical protein
MGMLLHESVSVKVGIQGPLILSFSPSEGEKGRCGKPSPPWGRVWVRGPMLPPKPDGL